MKTRPNGATTVTVLLPPELVARVDARLAVRLQAIPGSRVTRADVVGEDRASDLAVLRVNAWNLPSLALDESRRLRVGQLVLAIGNPLRFERSVSLGVVSAIERSLPGPGRRPFEIASSWLTTIRTYGR